MKNELGGDIMKNPFKNLDIRALYDKKNKKYWFCAVDVIEVLTGNAYKQARSYWGTYKGRSDYFSVYLGYKNPQITMPHRTNGRFYKMDVVDVEGILHIIRSIPHKGAGVFKRALELLGNKRTQRNLNNVGRRSSPVLLEVIKEARKVIVFSVSRVERFVIGDVVYRHVS